MRVATLSLLTVLLLSATTADAAVYEIDPVHTQITFFVDHMGFSRSSGRAYGSHGLFVFREGDWASACVEATVPAARIGFGDEAWDRRMRRRDFLDADNHPDIHFRSIRIEPLDAMRARVHGELTIRDVSRPLVLELQLNRVGYNIAAGRRAAGFSATATLKRSDFGMTALLPRIADEVNIVIEAEGWRRRFEPGQTRPCRPPETE